MAYACRKHNGDLRRNCDSVMINLVTIAECLEKKVEISSTKIALDRGLEQAINLDKKEAKDFIPIALEDVMDILSRKFYIIEVFYKAYDIFHYGNYNDNSLNKMFFLLISP